MMEQRCGFSPPFVRKQAVNASVPSLPLSEGPSSPRLFQRLPWRGLRMGQCPLSPILKRKFTVSCLTQRSASPHPGPAFKEKAVPSPPPNPTPPSSSPPSRAKCPTRSPSPPQRETVGRSLCGQPANGGAPSSVLGYKDLTVRDARRRDMDLDELLKKASAFLHRNPVGRVDPHVALKLHPVQTVTISEQRTEISQQADNSDGRSEGLPTVLECLNSHFWLGSVLPNSRVPTSTQDPGEPFTSPPWNSTPGIRRPCYSLQPGQETKAQNSLQNPYPRGPLDGKPCQDDEWPHSGIVGLQSCSLIPTRSARIESGIPRLDPKGTLRETRVPPSGHGSLDTAKHSTSVQLKCNNLVPTQDIRVPQPEGTLGLRDHLKPSPTQSPDLSQCTKQDDELPTPTLYTHLQRRLQRGRSRVAPSLNEAGSPLGLGASRRKLQDNSKPIECLRTPREAKRRHFHEGLEEDKKVGSGMSDMVQDPKPKPAVPMKPSAMGSQLLGYVGIDTIIEQMRRKTMKTGFDFNIMVVGQSGLGKSTLVNTLFKSQVSRKSCGRNREEKVPKTVEIRTVSHVIEEKGVKMKLTVIDTPGFGDQINNDNCWEPIEKYISEQYEKFLKEEANIARKKRIPDTRVHCCLYFISPTGHSLRPLDVEFMKRLGKIMNIIPVIAKADTMTLEERHEFKLRVRKELESNGIEFYPQREFDEDMEDKMENDKIRETMPFAIIGSDTEYQINGKRVLGRKTPWGIIEVENVTHCEFPLLRDLIVRTHLQDLKEVTHNIFYETYRAKRLNENGNLAHDTVEAHESNL